VRVHEEILQRQKLPEDLVTKRIWDDRLEDMRNFERYLSRNGIVVLKFFLHVSHKEQKKRFMDRLDRKEKNWKFSVNDIQERQYWKSYMKVYEDAIKGTASGHAPWFVVPADNKWFTRLVVAGAIVDALERLDLDYPKVDKNQQNALKQARELLASEKKR
jgi:polyphosphate kinase 2 (PPK2 family)